MFMIGENINEKTTFYIVARSALSNPWVTKIWCSSVRPSVRKIIGFCEGDLGGGTRAAVYW